MRTKVAGVDVALMSGEDCRLLAEELSVMVKTCSAKIAQAAARASDCNAHRGAGFRDAKAWLARTSGTTAVEAGRMLDTGRLMETCPDTKRALIDGKLSMAQAAEITRTEQECPGSEGELARIAERSDMQSLKDAARD